MSALLTSILNNPGFIRYLKNTSWMMAEQLLRIIAGLFVGIWVARYLGPEQFGLFNYVIAFTAIFGGIAKLGLDGIIVRELVKYPEKRDTYLGTAFWLKILGAFLVIGIIAAIVPFTSNDATTNLFIFIISAGLVFQSFEVVEFYFQSQVLAKIVSICKVIQLALSSMIKVYLVLTESELIYFVLVTAFDALSLAVSYAIAYKLRKNSAFYKHFDPSIAEKLLKDSWPLIFSAIVIMIYMRIDQIMIKEMLGEHEVGIYSAAVKLSEAWYFIPTVIATTLFPAIVKYKQISEMLFYEKFQNFSDLLFYLGLFIAGFIILFNNQIVSLLFGASYAESSSVLAIHALGGVVVALTVAQGQFWITFNLQKQLLFITVSCASLNIILNYSMIPVYRNEGAALSTVISYIVGAFFFPYLVPPARKMLFHSYSSLNFIRVVKCLTRK